MSHKCISWLWKKHLAGLESEPRSPMPRYKAVNPTLKSRCPQQDHCSIGRSIVSEDQIQMSFDAPHIVHRCRYRSIPTDRLHSIHSMPTIYQGESWNRWRIGEWRWKGKAYRVDLAYLYHYSTRFCRHHLRLYKLNAKRCEFFCKNI
jgi:hypothetical protein